jgi:hypothetical protein
LHAPSVAAARGGSKGLTLSGLRNCHQEPGIKPSVRQQPRRGGPRPAEGAAAPMRRLEQDRSARIVIAGHAFVQNVRHGHYEVAVEGPTRRRLAVAFDELALAI